MTLLYIDPGTGAMLFSVVMGMVTALFYFLQKLILKIKFLISGGKIKVNVADKKPFVIFSDSKRYWNVFKPICDEFEKRKVKCEYWTASPDDMALREKYEYVHCEFIGEGNKAYAKLNIMNACICLATTPGLDVYQWKRSKNCDYYVHILHEVGGLTEYRMFGLDYYDAVLLSGEFQKEQLHQLEAVRKLKEKETCVVGSTYMDTMEKRLLVLNKSEKDGITVLLAPSWGESSILNRYGSKLLQCLVDTGYKIVVRPHPQTATSDPELLKQLQLQFPESDNFKWNFDNDNFNALNEADILISDFSGVIFDYTLIFDRPMIYADTNFDSSPYDAVWIDEEIWRYKALPSLGKQLNEEDFTNLKQIIDTMLSDEKYRTNRNKVKDEAWQHRGEASVRTVDFLEEKYISLTTKFTN